MLSQLFDPKAYTWCWVRLLPGSKACRSRPGASQTSNPLHGNIFDWRGWSKQSQLTLKKYSTLPSSLGLFSVLSLLHYVPTFFLPTKWWFKSLRMLRGFCGALASRDLWQNELWWECICMYDRVQSHFCVHVCVYVCVHVCICVYQCVRERQSHREIDRERNRDSSYNVKHWMK